MAGGVLSQSSRPPGYQDAVDEARIAAEQIVIPRQQAIELLPRTQQLLDIQVTIGTGQANPRSINGHGVRKS